MIRSVQQMYPQAHCVVYTGDLQHGVVGGEDIIRLARERFGITLTGNVDFIQLHNRRFLEAKMYPHFTLLGQSFGSTMLAVEAMAHLVPHVFVDTVGYAFTYPIVKSIGRCKVISYTHYPTISSDMLSVVQQRQTTFNNQGAIARNPLLSRLKLSYYNIFADAYALCARFCDLVMVNSTWTRGHIDDIWDVVHKTHIVYPPCSTDELLKYDSTHREPLIVSVAQFRPEKNHEMQLRAFHEYVTIVSPEDTLARLVLIGGCRNDEDRQRVASLESLITELGLTERVDIVVNAPHAQLLSYLSKSSIGLHCMKDEHFGIGVVEYMAAGLVTIAHKSGGPLMDIVGADETRGYLANSVDTYAQCFKRGFNLNEEQRRELVFRGRASVNRFSDAAFSDNVTLLLEPIITPLKL